MAAPKGQEESALRKLIIYGALFIAALMIPTRATELGKMKPVETVCIYKDRNMVVIETDTEDMGRGKTVSDALLNLKETTAGTVYLDTATYLLVMEDAEPYIPEIAGYLKKTVWICGAEGEIEVKDAASFLSVHKPEVKLKDWRKGTELEVLKEEKGRLILTEKAKNSLTKSVYCGSISRLSERIRAQPKDKLQDTLKKIKKLEKSS